jgi:hypothetical protein
MSLSDCRPVSSAGRFSFQDVSTGNGSSHLPPTMIRPSARSACRDRSSSGSRQQDKQNGLVVIALAFGTANAINIPPMGRAVHRPRWHARQAAMPAF